MPLHPPNARPRALLPVCCGSVLLEVLHVDVDVVGVVMAMAKGVLDVAPT